MSFETEYQNWLGQENLEPSLKEQLEKEFSAQVELGTLSDETDYKTVWNQSLKSIFLPFILDDISALLYSCVARHLRYAAYFSL